MAFLRRPSALVRVFAPALLITLALYNLATIHELVVQFTPLTRSAPWAHLRPPTAHPIDQLIRDADRDFAATLSKATRSLPEAAAAYRRRRGRHPPPGFDRWHEFAREKDAIIVEDFWDQIYHDLEPFWAVEPAQIRRRARDVDMHIEVRNHNASTSSDWFWTQIWLDMIRTIEHLLPDVDLALNAMDEPRVVVPWEEIDGHVRKAAKTRRMPDAQHVESEFGTQAPEALRHSTPETTWEDKKHYWRIARRGCPPDSAARRAPVVTDFDRTPAIASSFELAHMRSGYVANYTLSTSFCHQADLQALEGIFVEPLSVSATASLVPVFGGSKLAVNNDILLPAPMYWSAEDRFTGAEGAATPWASKQPTAIWRGVATGGRNRATNWRSFQRHRFVAMNNGTQLALAEADPAGHPPANFALPAREYRLAAARPRPSPPGGSLGHWIASATDVAFTDLMCAHPGFAPGCNYTGGLFAAREGVPMAEQFAHKFLPDVDGNSFSGRYLGFLRSTSLPVKATLWREWHDARLVAWKHFVPMDSRFGDWYGILEYFAGNPAAGVPGRDGAAEAIAQAGRDWALRALRKEDMQVYVLRLLLEYARVVDERREVLGWVGDLA